MRLVQNAEIRPMRCAVLPQIGHSHDKGFVDTGSEMPGFDNHVYVSVVALEEMCRLAGFPTVIQHEQLTARCGELADRVVALEQENARLKTAMDSVQVLKQYGMRQERKPGRPSTKAAA